MVGRYSHTRGLGKEIAEKAAVAFVLYVAAIAATVVISHFMSRATAYFIGVVILLITVPLAMWHRQSREARNETVPRAVSAMWAKLCRKPRLVPSPARWASDAKEIGEQWARYRVLYLDDLEHPGYLADTLGEYLDHAVTTAAAARLASAVDLAPGTLVADRYDLISLVGTGGLGSAYRALDQESRHEVALKIARLQPDTVESFLQIHRDVKRYVDSPHLIQILDIGTVFDGAYIAMELATDSLRSRLRQGPLPVVTAVRMATGLFEGLAALHAHGFVHGDVKPANVLISEIGEVKLADFGLAFVHGGRENPGTTHSFVGTLNYIAPEQALGQSIPASDLYSAGIVLFEMLAGRLPFDRKTDLGVLLAQLREPPPDLRVLRPEVPRWLLRLVRSLLAKKPEDRPITAEAVITLLRRRRLR